MPEPGVATHRHGGCIVDLAPAAAGDGDDAAVMAAVATGSSRMRIAMHDNVDYCDYEAEELRLRK
jgi:hypothetical protein